MAMQPITDPLMLDSTGQQILSALQDIAEATQPTNVYIDLEVTIPASGWSNETPSSYTWTSEQVTTECAVEVYFANGSENVLTPYIQYEKGSQSVVFTSPAKPNANIPVIIRIINAKAESINNVTDEMVSTSVISGASNVKQALTTINSDISSLNSNMAFKDITTQAQLNENIHNSGTKVYKSIKMVILSINFRITESAEVNTNIIGNLPVPFGENAVYGSIAKADGTAVRIRVRGSGILDNEDAITAGWYNGNLAYPI